MTGSSPTILLVDDDDDLRDALAMALTLADLPNIAVGDAPQALGALGSHDIAVVISDIRMPGIDGRQLLQRVRAFDADLPVILITGHGDIEQAVTAVHQGAYDFLAKPFATERLIETVRRAAEKRQLVIENRRLRSEAATRSVQLPLPLIGNSPAVQRLSHVIVQLAGTGVDVLIEGEWGVGKRAVAQALAQADTEQKESHVLFDCEALPAHLIATVLFGDGVSGNLRRFKDKGGALAAAHGRTLLLAGVDALPMALQSRLLHSLAVRDLADRDPAPPGPIRVVSTTTVNLMDRVEGGSFRSDLYFRIAPVRLVVPPLRERAADIPLLFMRLLEAAAHRFQRPVPDLSDAMLSRLTDHHWPGNLRELQNYAEQAILNLDRAEEHLVANDGQSLPFRVARFEAEAIRAALRSEGGRITACCQRLGIPRKTLYDKFAKYGIKPEEFRRPADGSNPKD